MSDRRFLGLLGISLVVSTVLTGITFNVKEEERVRFLASTMPSAVQCEEQATRVYSFEFMVTRELPDVRILCGLLIKRASIPGEIPWGVDGLQRKALITHLLEELDDLADGSPFYRVYEVQEDSGTKLEILDFGDFLAAMGGKDLLRTCDTLYAEEEDRSGNVSFYRGVRDFFFNSERTLLEVKYSSPGESRVFRSESLGTQAEGYPPISEAPLDGIWLRNLVAGDRVRVEVKANTQNMPYWRLLGEIPFCHEGIIRLVVVETGQGTAGIRTDRVE